MMWHLSKLFRRSQTSEVAHALYLALVAQARRPEFYAQRDVPDTLDGRFELITLHAFLVIRRLNVEGEIGQKLSQALFDAMFGDMDRALREMGVGDLGVGKRVKMMAKGHFGRAAAYEAALLAGKQSLIDVLLRNLYGTVVPKSENVAVLADYLVRESKTLAVQERVTLFKGEISFGSPP